MIKNIKHIKIMITAALLALGMSAGVSFAVLNPGDVDGDGTVTTADGVLAARHTVGLVILTGDAFSNADVNKDGVVRTDDAVLISQFADGIITEFPTNEPVQVTIIYTYDDLNRLEQVDRPLDTIHYDYDEVGNITEKSIY